MKLVSFDFKASVNRRILHTALVVGISSLLPKAAMVVRDLAIARHFGTSDDVDAFLLALLLPSLVVQVVVSAFATSLIPVFIRLREKHGAEAAADLSARAGSFGVMVLAALTALMALAGPWLIPLAGPGFPAAKQALTLHYFTWLVPLVLAQGAATIWTALLNAGGRFALVTLMPALTPLLVLAVLFSPLSQLGMTPVAVATLAGGAAEAAMGALMMHRQGLKLWRAGWNSRLVEVLRQTLPMAGGMALISGNLLIDQMFASLTGSGGIAMLAYGNKAVSFLVAMASLPLGVAVLPHFSEQVAREDWLGLRHSLKVWTLLILAATIPLTALIIAGSEPIIRLLFQRGQFSADDTAMVATLQQFYVLQLPFQLLGILGGRMLIALGLNRRIMLIATANLAVNTAADYALLQMMGLNGIALATSVTYAGSVLMVFSTLARKLPKP